MIFQSAATDEGLLRSGIRKLCMYAPRRTNGPGKRVYGSSLQAGHVCTSSPQRVYIIIIEVRSWDLCLKIYQLSTPSTTNVWHVKKQETTIRKKNNPRK